MPRNIWPAKSGRWAERSTSYRAVVVGVGRKNGMRFGAVSRARACSKKSAISAGVRSAAVSGLEGADLSS